MRRDDVLHRRVAPFVDAYGLRYRALSQKQAALRQRGHDPPPGFARGQTGKVARQIGHPPGAVQRDAQRQVMRVPPGHIRRIAEGTAHHRARALLRVSARIGQNGHPLVEVRHARLLADESRVARIVRVNENRHTRG